MINFLMQNLPTILVSLSLILIGLFAIRKIIRDKRRGACSSCSMKESCDKCNVVKKDKDKNLPQ